MKVDAAAAVLACRDVSKRYGLQLKADSEDNHRIFSSLRSLAEYVAAHKTK